MRIAVIASDIASLGSACLLSYQHHVVLCERESRLGGLTHTHKLDRQRAHAVGATAESPSAIHSGAGAGVIDMNNANVKWWHSSFLLNLLGFQAVWITCVVGAATCSPWQSSGPC